VVEELKPYTENAKWEPYLMPFLVKEKPF